MIVKYIYVVYHFNNDTLHWEIDGFHKTYKSACDSRKFLMKNKFLNCMITRQEIIEDWVCSNGK